jgi:hypothetical protein
MRSFSIINLRVIKLFVAENNKPHVSLNGCIVRSVKSSICTRKSKTRGGCSRFGVCLSILSQDAAWPRSIVCLVELFVDIMFRRKTAVQIFIYVRDLTCFEIKGRGRCGNSGAKTSSLHSVYNSAGTD